MLNKVILMGRLTKDPELRVTQSGKQVCSFTLAVDRDYQSSGEKKDVDFIECTIWNGGAEFVNRNFRKGKLMAVTGKLQSRKWQDRDGNNRTEWGVMVENSYFCGDRPQRFEELQKDDGDLPF